MIHSNSAIEIALRIATKAHEGQIDRGGRPYIEHPKTVAAFCSSPLEKVVALLHDVIEDTGVSQQDLKDAGIPDEAIQAIVTMTHGEGESYDDYIDRVKAVPLARIVKLADLKHNQDVSRIPNPDESDLARLEKYRRAEKTLQEAAR